MVFCTDKIEVMVIECWVLEVSLHLCSWIVSVGS